MENNRSHCAIACSVEKALADSWDVCLGQGKKSTHIRQGILDVSAAPACRVTFIPLKALAPA